MVGVFEGVIFGVGEFEGVMFGVGEFEGVTGGVGFGVGVGVGNVLQSDLFKSSPFVSTIAAHVVPSLSKSNHTPGPFPT
jgi:hypothetical protein